MKNKTVIRKKLVPNQFTSIHKSIIEDTRLTGNGLRLLISILGDDDDNFSLSQTTYCNRLKMDKETFTRAIENLIKCGYVKRTLINESKSIPGIKKAGSKKKVYFYTVSEHGNLSTEVEVDVVKEEQEKEPEPKIDISYKLIIDTLNPLIINADFLIDTKGLQKYIINAFNNQKITKLEQISNESLNKIINKFKIQESVIEEVNEIITEKEITNMVEERVHVGTHRKTVLAKILKRYKENPSMTRKDIGGKIVSFNSEFRKTASGNQD